MPVSCQMILLLCAVVLCVALRYGMKERATPLTQQFMILFGPVFVTHLISAFLLEALSFGFGEASDINRSAIFPFIVTGTLDIVFHLPLAMPAGTILTAFSLHISRTTSMWLTGINSALATALFLRFIIRAKE